jgi:hypothetical protein
MHPRGCLSLPGSPDKLLPRKTWRSALRFFAKTLRFFSQALI